MAGCGLIEENSVRNDNEKMWSFGQELSFFNKYNIDTVILGEDDSLIAVSPAWQARVMTSTFGGVKSPALGWINRELIAFKKDDVQTNQVGGEDRFWVGPQGGEGSLFFPQGKIFSEENWMPPAFITKEEWKLVAKNQMQAKFEKTAQFENAKGVQFKIKAEREISVLTKKQVAEILGIEIPSGVNMVAFQSLNKIINAGQKEWSPANGTINISVQSCFNATKNTFVFIPYRQGDLTKLGDIMRDDYYEPSVSIAGSSKRLVVTDEYIRFKSDGRVLSGISIPPRRSEGVALSYDDKNKVLTIITYLRPIGNRTYLPSSWRRSANATNDGDAISIFNNGPLNRTSAPADAFFEISTYSPALMIAPNKSQFHLQRTFHFSGSEYDLGLISYKLAGLSIGQLRGESE